MELKHKVLLGKILIPQNPLQKISYSDLINPKSTLFRTILHQGELCPIFILVQIPSLIFPANFKIQDFIRCTEIRPIISLKISVFFNLCVICRKEKNKSGVMIPDSVGLETKCMTGKINKAEEILENDEKLEKIEIKDPISPIKFAYFCKEISLMIYQIELNISIFAILKNRCG